MGCKRQVTCGSALRSTDDERASRLDAEARRGVPCAGAGCHGRRAADAREGLRQEEARDDQRAGREREGGAEPAGHLDRTRCAGLPLCSLLRTAGGLRRLAVHRLSGVSLLLGLSWLHCRRRDRDRSRVWRSLRARTVGVRRVLGPRWLLGRQPHQLGWRWHQRQSRRPCRALAAQSGPPGRRAVQQCKPAAAVWWRQSHRRQPHGCRHRRRRRRGCRRRSCRPAKAGDRREGGQCRRSRSTRRRQGACW